MDKPISTVGLVVTLVAAAGESHHRHMEPELPSATEVLDIVGIFGADLLGGTTQA